MTCVTALYLRSICNVTIRGVIYAPAIGDDGFCRFVDLKPMMDILDWIAGVHAVTKYVDGAPMYSLVHGLQGALHRAGEYRVPPVHLTSWASLLWQFTDAVRLSRLLMHYMQQQVSFGISRR
jgi:hypothetical protein